MTDLVRKSRPKTSRQPSLFLSLQILEVAGSNLYCEPAPPAFSAEVPVRTCTANRLHRFTGSPTYGMWYEQELPAGENGVNMALAPELFFYQQS